MFDNVLPIGVLGGSIALGVTAMLFAALFRRQTEKPASENEMGPLLPSGVAAILEPKPTLKKTVDALLDYLVQFPGVDCAGVYLFRESDGTLNLIDHRGCSEFLLEKGRRLEADSPRARLVKAGATVRRDFLDVMAGENNADLIMAGLRSLAIVPVKYDGSVIGSINVGSRIKSSVSIQVVKNIETVAQQVAGILFRQRTEATR